MTRNPDNSELIQPVTYAGAKVPVRADQGKISTEGDPKLLKQFLPAAQFDVQDRSEEKDDKEKRMDMLMFYMIMNNENGENSDVSDTSLAERFDKLVKALHMENVEVEFEGKKITLGELSTKFQSYNGSFPYEGFVPGVMGRAHLPLGSKFAAMAIGKLEGLASKMGVLDDIQHAAKIVGVDYGFMLTTAYRESGFRAGVGAATSTAKGLYQFVEGTWISTVMDNRRLLESQGFHIGSSRAEVLALRSDPRANALMGACLARDSQSYLERHVNVPGYQVSAGDLYLAHFLGQGGAEKLIEAAHKNPGASAAALFPDAARANKDAFAGRSVEGLRSWAEAKMAGPSPSPA